MMDREKLIKHFEHLLNAAKGNYQDFVDLTVDAGEEILALLQEQEDMGKELMDAIELIHKKNERIEKLLKKQEAVVRCKDCKQSGMDSASYPHYWCSAHSEYHDGDWFCADVKRRTE